MMPLSKLLSTFRPLLQTGFVKGVLVLGSGTALSQLVTIVSLPVLTRLFDPEDFGVLAVFTAIVSVLSMLACLRYDSAIVIAQEDDQGAENLLVASVIIALCFGGLTALGAGLFGGPITQYFNIGANSDILLLAPVGIVLAGIVQAFNGWAMRDHDFRSITIAGITHSLVQAIFQITAGFLGVSGATSLIKGYLAGALASTAVLAGGILYRDGLVIARAASPRVMFRELKKHRNFPLFLTWANLISSFSNQLVLFLVLFFFGKKIAGLYSLGNRVLHAPVALVGNAIGSVYFARVAKDPGSENSKQITISLVRYLGGASLLVVLILLAIAPALFELFFGSEWREAGVLAQWLLPLFVCRVAIVPLSHSFSIYGKQNVALVWQISMVAVTAGGISAGANLGGIYWALGFYSAGVTFLYLVMLYLCLGYNRASLLELFTLRFPARGES